MNSNDAEGDDLVRSGLFLFTEANKFGRVVSPHTMKTSAIEVLAGTFFANIERIRDMVSVPQIMATAATEHLLPYSEAVFAILGKPVMDDPDLVRMREVNAEYRKRHASASADDKRPNATKFYTTNVLNYHKYNYIPEYAAGFHALLSFQVVGAWTAFDSLVTDVWIQTVNLCPRLATVAYEKMSFTVGRLRGCQKTGFEKALRVA